MTQFVMEIHQQLAELCSSQALPRQEDIKKFPAKLSLLDKPETASFIELLQSVDRFECFFDPQYREESEPWRLIQDMEYCDDVSIQGTPGRLAMRISYLPGKEVRIAASFLEDKLDVNGASREWPMVFSFREDPKTLNFRTDPSFCSIHEPANVKNKLKNILNKQVWNMMKGHYCQALIPIPAGYPRMVEDLRILAKNKTKNMMAGVTVREIHVPSDQGAYAAALVVAPMEIVALLTDN